MFRKVPNNKGSIKKIRFNTKIAEVKKIILSLTESVISSALYIKAT